MLIFLCWTTLFYSEPKDTRCLPDLLQYAVSWLIDTENQPEQAPKVLSRYQFLHRHSWSLVIESILSRCPDDDYNALLSLLDYKFASSPKVRNTDLKKIENRQE